MAVEVIAASAIPISSFCASLACSAAYHLIAGTKRIIASPSATVGNIGTILSWADDTEFWNAMGIEWKALVNEGADLKSTGHLEPDETQIAFLQESINESGKAFRDHVQKHRPGINAEVFRAGWYSGEKAKALGLTDEIGTLETAVAAKPASRPAAPSAVKSPAAPASSVKPPAPASTRPAQAAKPATAPAKALTGLARVSAAFASQAKAKAESGPPVITRAEFNALTESDKADFRAAKGRIA